MSSRNNGGGFSRAPPGGTAPFLNNRRNMGRQNSTAPGDTSQLAPIQLLGVSGPTLLEGVLSSATYLKQVDENRNKELVTAAQEGKIQSILAFTVPIEIFNKHAGTYGAIHTNLPGLSVSMTRDGDTNNMQSFPVSGGDAEQLLRLFFMLPLAGLHLITTQNNKNPLPPDPLKKLHDAIMATSIYQKNNATDSTSSSNQQNYTSWADQLDRIYKFAVEANIKLHGDSGLGEDIGNIDSNKLDDGKDGLKFSWWPMFVEDIINPKTDDTVALRFWMFIPTDTSKNPCESLSTIFADAAQREREISEAIKNLLNPRKKKSAPSSVQSNQTTTSKKKKKSPKKKKKKFKQTTLLDGMIQNCVDDEAEEVDEDESSDDPMVTADTDSVDASTNAASENIDNKEQFEDTNDIPLKRYWEAPLLDLVKTTLNLKKARSTFINGGDVQMVHKRVKEVNVEKPANTTARNDKKGKSKVESIYDSDNEESREVLEKNEWINDDNIKSLDDFFAAANKNMNEDGSDNVSGSSSTYNGPFGRPDTFELTGYSNYMTVNTAFNFSGYNNCTHEKSHLLSEDCNSILHPANIFSPTISMTSWCSVLAHPSQRDIRKYFDIFDSKYDRLIPGNESNIHKSHLDDPHLWLSKYMEEVCPDIKGWPSYSCGLGYVIRKTLSEYIHNPNNSNRPYTSAQYSRFEALHFKGFPNVKRVWLFSPIITPPWRLDILPRPDFIRNFPFFTGAIDAICRKDKFLLKSESDKWRNIFRSNNGVKANFIADYEYPRLCLQILYGASFNTLKETAGFVYKEAHQLPHNIWTQTSQQQSLAIVYSKDHLKEAKDIPITDLVSSDDIGRVLSAVSNILRERFLQLASCQDRHISDSASSRGLIVTARMPSTVASPSLDRPTSFERSQLQNMGKVDIDAFFRQNNILLHFRWVAEHLEALKKSIFKTPVLEYTMRAKEVRSILNTTIDKEISAMKQFMFEAVVQDPYAVPLTTVMRQALEFYKTVKDNTQICWPYCQSNAYENLSLLGEETVSFVVYMLDIFQVHANVVQAIIIRDAVLAASRYTPSTATQFPNILMPGTAGTGKSHILKVVQQSAIPNTYMEVSSATNKAFNINGCNDDLVYINEETSNVIFGNALNKANNEIVATLKQRTESGLVTTLAFDNSDAATRGGASARNSKHVICSCQGSNIFATNENLSQADKALLSRFLICNFGFVNESKFPKGFTLQDRALQGARDGEARDIINEYGPTLQIQHLHYILVEKMIQTKAIKDVEMTNAVDLIANILGELRDIIGREGVANRLMGHIRWNLRTETIKQAIYAVHCNGLVDKYKYNETTGAINPYSLEILFKEIPKFLFVSKEIVIKVLTKFSEQLDKPVRTDILRSLAIDAYPGCDLNKAKFWTRNIANKPNPVANKNHTVNHNNSINGISSGFNQYPGSIQSNRMESGPRTEVDRNYITVRLPGTTRENAINNLGNKLGRVQLKTQQLDLELKNLQAQMITIIPEKDQNGPIGIPPLKAKKKSKKRKHSGHGSKKGKEKIRDEDNNNSDLMDVDNNSIQNNYDLTDEQLLAMEQYQTHLSSDIMFTKDIEEEEELKNKTITGTTTSTSSSNILNEDISNSSFVGSEASTLDADAAEIARNVLNIGARLLEKQALETTTTTTNKKSSSTNKRTTVKTPVNKNESTKRDTEQISGPLPVTYAEAMYSSVQCCDPVTSITESPLMRMDKDADGWLLAIYEPFLRKYLKFVPSSDVESPLMNSIRQSLNTSCLEQYPRDVIELLDEECGHLSPIKNKSLMNWMEETKQFEYLVCTNDTRDIIAEVRDELNNGFPEDVNFFRYLRTTKLKRNINRKLRLYNFTGPSEAVKGIVANPETNALVIKSKQNYNRILEYDIDWYAYVENCNRNNVDPMNKDWIYALPRFTKLAAIHKTSLKQPQLNISYNRDAQYPKTLIISHCKSFMEAYKTQRKTAKENEKTHHKDKNKNINGVGLPSPKKRKTD